MNGVGKEREHLFSLMPLGKRYRGMEMIWNKDNKIGEYRAIGIGDKMNSEDLGF